MPGDHHRHDQPSHRHHNSHKRSHGEKSHKSHHHSHSRSRSRKRREAEEREREEEHREHREHRREKRRDRDHQDGEPERGTWHGRQRHPSRRARETALSPSKSSTMPAMSPVTSHHYSHNTLTTEASTTAPMPPTHRFQEIDTSALTHHSSAASNSRGLVRPSSPVLTYSKSQDPGSVHQDYRAKKPKLSSSQQPPAMILPEGELPGGNGNNRGDHVVELHKELSEKIRQRRRSHSMSSRGERGCYNGDGEEKSGGHHSMIGQRSIELESGPGSRGFGRQERFLDHLTSNDTVFFDKELLSDLYIGREKDIKCTDTSQTKRSRTKSESRALSEENSPTRPSVQDNDKIVNLLKGNRRPLEVDAREFRVLKEKLLREHQLPTAAGSNLKRESKKFKGDFVQDSSSQQQQQQNSSRPNKNVECELKSSDKLNNGRVPGSGLSQDDEVFWKEPETPGHHIHKEIVLDMPLPPPASHGDDIRLKSSRKSRRENYEIEAKDYKHKPFLENEPGELKQRRHIDMKSSLEKHVPNNISKDLEPRKQQKDGANQTGHHYTKQEKEWLKEKLLQEFERQEKIAKTDPVIIGGQEERQLANGSAKGGPFLSGLEGGRMGKENPINFMISGEAASSRKPSHLSSHKSTSNGHAHHSHDVTDKSDLGTVDLSVSGMLSPPCTCGAGEDSEPEIETTRRLPVSEERRQGKEIEAGRHSQERRYRASQELMAQEEARSGATKSQESQSRKSAKGPRSSGGSKDWNLSELVELSRDGGPGQGGHYHDALDNGRNAGGQMTSTRLGKESPVKKDSLSSGANHLQPRASPSVHGSRHQSRGREREVGGGGGKPNTIPRERSPSKSRLRDVSPAVVSVSESCDHFQVTQGSHEPVSTKQNSRHSFSYDSSLPRSPPPYIHPKSGGCSGDCHASSHAPSLHPQRGASAHAQSQDCGCTSCDCAGYTSEENLHGHVNGGFHRNGSVRSTDCHPLHHEAGHSGHGGHQPPGGPGGHNHHTLDHSYKDHLPLYPDMDNTRGKVNIVIFSGGIKLRRQHWCFLALVLVVVIISLGVLLPNSAGLVNLTKEEQKNLVAQILTEVPLIDGHNDLPWNIRQFIHNKLDKVNLSSNIAFSSPWSTSKWSHTDLYRMRAGMVGCQLWTAYAPCGSQHKDAVQITLEQIDLIKRLVDLYPDYLQLVHTSQEIIDAHKGGKIASFITVESGHSIGTSLGVLRTFQRLGVRALTLTHNCDTPWADCSNADKPGAIPQHNGLTQFGKTVVQEMNKLGIIVDLSHTSVQTARHALDTSLAPVIFSHSSAHAICNASRNVPDDILRIVAEKRGLVMVNFFSYFLTCSNHSTLNDVVNHINHIRSVAGVDSVGIGASYDGINEVPVGLPDVSHYPELFVALLDSGTWSLEDLSKLAGLNFLRVLREVEKVAADLEAGA